MVAEAAAQGEQTEAQMTKEEEAQRRDNNVVALIYALFLAGVGIPLWWKTTEVYRAKLPYGRISDLAGRPLSVTVAVELVARHEEHAQKALLISRSLTANHGRVVIGQHVILDFAFTVRGVRPEERHLLPTKSVKIEPDRLSGNLSVFLLPANQVDRMTIGCDSPPRLYVPNDDDISADDVASDISRQLKDVFLNCDRIRAFLRREFRSAFDSHKRDQELVEWNVNALRPAYALELFIVDPSPRSHSAVADYGDLNFPILKSFLHNLSSVVNISLTSQMLYYIDFPMAPQYNGSNYYYVADELPHLINPMESYMGSYVTTKPVIRLLLYLTPEPLKPLYVMQPDGQPAKYNSYIVEGWGGVVLINEMRNKGRMNVETELAMIALLRNYFGLNLRTLRASFSANRMPLCPWELQLLMYYSSVNNALTTVRTLNSLTSLLSRINNIVIEDKVAKKIWKSVDALDATYAALSQPGNLIKAVQYGKEAYNYAEETFFDHSLMELLHFPEDQKYAIYVPLFLPLSFPVIASVFRMIRMYKERKQKKD